MPLSPAFHRISVISTLNQGNISDKGIRVGLIIIKRGLN